MTITMQTTAEKLGAYLHHEITLAELVSWAEEAFLEGDWVAEEVEALRPVIARLGLTDVRAFGLAWEDCEQLLAQLGYRARVDVLAA